MRRIAILAYHRVNDALDDLNFTAVNLNNFKMHMEYIKKNYDVIGIKELSHYIELDGRDTIVLTFDDGYEDMYLNAVPVLKKFELPATFFITTKNIDISSENWTDYILRALFHGTQYKSSFCIKEGRFRGYWKTESLYDRVDLYHILRKIYEIATQDEKEYINNLLIQWSGLSNDGRASRKILTKNEIQEIAKINGMTIGVHTVSHPFLDSLRDEIQQKEIEESKQQLERVLEKTMDYFAYPFGRYNKNTLRILQKLGFNMAFTTERKLVDKNDNLLELPRFGVKNYNIDDFKCFLGCEVFGNKSEKKNVHVGNYIGRLENDFELFQNNKPIIIWGAGRKGEFLYKELLIRNLSDRLVAFGDNNREKVGKVLFNLPILNYESIVERYGKEKIFLVYGRYDMEIYQQLSERGEENIHILVGIS